MELNAKVPHEVGVFESLEYLQLVGRLFNGLVVVGLESDLRERKEVIFLIPSTLVLLLFHALHTPAHGPALVSLTHLFHGHQLARVHVDAGVHLPVLPFTFKRNE